MQFTVDTLDLDKDKFGEKLQVWNIKGEFSMKG